MSRYPSREQWPRFARLSTRLFGDPDGWIGAGVAAFLVAVVALILWQAGELAT